jgi:Cu-processing system ATP-binding protein
VRSRHAECDNELIDLFNHGASIDNPLRFLSCGMRQRINAALAFLFRSELLILDEPTAGLDPVSAGTLKDKMRREREAGRTIIVTSHVLSELDEVADRIAFLLDGVVRFSGSRDDLLRSTGELTLERAVADLMLAGAREGVSA